MGAFVGESCFGGCKGRLETNLALRSTRKLATWNCRIVQPVTIIGSKAQRLQTLYAVNPSVTEISIIKFNPSRISTLCMKEWSFFKTLSAFFPFFLPLTASFPFFLPLTASLGSMNAMSNKNSEHCNYTLMHETTGS